MRARAYLVLLATLVLWSGNWIVARAVRADILERIDGLLRQAARKGEAVPVAPIMSLAGLNADDAAALIAALRRRAPRRAKDKPAPSDNAFAKLRELGFS